jgi:iron complex transport system permease protein
MNFKYKKYYKTYFLTAIFLLIITIISVTNFGTTDVSFLDTSKIILSKIPIIHKFINMDGIKDTSTTIVINLRLPRILLAAVVGAALSVVGAAFQGIFRNPMADPYVLGISSGAALGATIAIVMGSSAYKFGISLTALFAFIGAMITVVIVYSMTATKGKTPTTMLLLAGIAISFFLSSLISLVKIFNREHLEAIMRWTMGSLTAASYKEVIFLTPIVIIGVGIIYAFSRDLNIMLTGEENAKTLGIEVEVVKKIVLLVSTLLVAVVVSVSGIIGFIGLIIPHTIRLIFGSDYKVVTFLSAFLGAIFLVICDTIARSIAPPMEIPVGIITSLFGVPFFIYLLFKNKGKVS